MATLSRALTTEERQILQVYRRAAGKVHERFWPYRHHKFSAQILRPGLRDAAVLIPDAEFIALLTAFRLVYAEKERSNFGRVANIVYRAGDDEARRLVQIMREGWRESPQQPWRFILDDEHFEPVGMLDTWINGEVFHQDEAEIPRVDRLKDLGAMAFLTIQLVVHTMCYSVLGLDNICALVLEEPLRPAPAPDNEPTAAG